MIMNKPFLSYTHIMWDWNGTLLDDVWLCVDIVNAMLRQRGKSPIDQKRYAELFDFPVKSYYQKVGFDFAQEPFEDLAAEYMRHYDSRQLECALCRHAREILRLCQQRGITQSILSASHQERLEHVVTAYNIRPFFLRLSGLTDFYATSKVTNGKALLTTVNAPPHEVLLVGDTTHDFDVARALGVDCVLIAGGHHSRRKLDSTSATIKNSLHELA